MSRPSEIRLFAPDEITEREMERWESYRRGVELVECEAIGYAARIPEPWPPSAAAIEAGCHLERTPGRLWGTSETVPPRACRRHAIGFLEWPRPFVSSRDVCPYHAAAAAVAYGLHLDPLALVVAVETALSSSVIQAHYQAGDTLMVEALSWGIAPELPGGAWGGLETPRDLVEYLRTVRSGQVAWTGPPADDPHHNADAPATAAIARRVGE